MAGLNKFLVKVRMRLVQEALGHEDLTATRIYIHIVNEELEEAMKT